MKLLPDWTSSMHAAKWCRLWICALQLGLAVHLAGCGSNEIENVTDYGEDTVKVALPDASSIGKGEPFPPIDSSLVHGLKPCDGFDFPVGPPNASRYFKARGFLPAGLEHLGEDWNGEHGGNTDFGDYVYAAADGIVFYADHYNNGWGTVIRLLHNYGTEAQPRYVETLYAHVASTWVEVGYRMKRGEVIGTIGSAEGKYHAHLHLEMRCKPGKDIRCGYDGDTVGFVDPTAFIEAHRPH
jgi:murein DD-endopeptidase MepM/ murein hydrolase activator NlpD